MAKILIVDDKANIRRVIGEFLEESGHQVQTARNGREAIIQLKKASYDIVLSDKSMPEMNGPILIRLINRNFPHIRTILMSCDKILDKDPGDYHLQKPFDLINLLSIISNLSRKKRRPA